LNGSCCPCLLSIHLFRTCCRPDIHRGRQPAEKYSREVVHRPLPAACVHRRRASRISMRDNLLYFESLHLGSSEIVLLTWCTAGESPVHRIGLPCIRINGRHHHAVLLHVLLLLVVGLHHHRIHLAWLLWRVCQGDSAANTSISLEFAVVSALVRLGCVTCLGSLQKALRVKIWSQCLF
jgi:hypothetical protein